MASNNDIDIRESTLRRTGRLLNILLADRTTKKNIIWATDSYHSQGEDYEFSMQIKADLITGNNSYLIQPRASKPLREQRKRTKDIAEVFTPLHIVEKMNRAIDEASKYQDINENNWQDYVRDIRIEITCGEAPFIASRYDPTSYRGEILPITKRVGFLDNKLRIVSEYCNKICDWQYWAKEAYKASYGYEWQGDNILIARENLLYTFVDNYKYKFSRKPSLSSQEEIANIISWNIFQMDGLKYVIPMSCHTEKKIIPAENALFWNNPEYVKEDECEGCQNNLIHKHNGEYARIMDWSTNKQTSFIDLLKS